MAGANPHATARAAVRRGGLTREDIDRIVGEVTDARASALLALDLTPDELEQAVMWASGQSDVMGKERRPLAGRVAAAYDVLAPDYEPGDGLD
ncbi:MAG TPA: hypothetical protein VFG47_05430 [Geminicoccaceae bacterium]|nr:hypothetical protein [Geminicoccaceae bacterium]